MEQLLEEEISRIALDFFMLGKEPIEMTSCSSLPTTSQTNKDQESKASEPASSKQPIFAQPVNRKEARNQFEFEAPSSLSQSQLLAGSTMFRAPKQKTSIYKDIQTKDVDEDTVGIMAIVLFIIHFRENDLEKFALNNSVRHQLRDHWLI